MHGENDGLPGLVVDRYDDTYVVKIYTAAWLPHVDAVRRRPGRCRPTVGGGAAAQPPRRGRGVGALGDLPGEAVPFLEDGLMFEADVVRGQKTGYFLDQRDNRSLVATMTNGARVLDVFACTGGFSVHAAAGGAIGGDERRPEHDGAGDGRAQHGPATPIGPPCASCRHDVEAGDAFDVMAGMARRRPALRRGGRRPAVVRRSAVECRRRRCGPTGG